MTLTQRPARLEIRGFAYLVAGFLALALAAPVAGQDEPDASQNQDARRYRVTGGLQVTPRYPGSDAFQPSPMVNFDRARGDEPFKFEAPDDGFGIDFVNYEGFSFGPIANFEDSRTARDVGAELPKVGFSLEAGGVVRYELGDYFRVRAEVRKGLTGHKGWVGTGGADMILRDGDKWLFSIGPRVTWSDNRYQDAYFSVAPADSAASGLPAFDAGGGIQAYGATASFLTQISPRWGVWTYAKYDRLTGDAGDSPIVLVHGSRNQFSAGLALTYTFRNAAMDKVF